MTENGESGQQDSSITGWNYIELKKLKSEVHGLEAQVGSLANSVADLEGLLTTARNEIQALRKALKDADASSTTSN